MSAIFRRELRSYYTTMTAAVFTAFLLLAVRIYTVALNFSYGYPNFEYALQNVGFIFMIIVPILTMRSFAEEKQQKTDQLLYSLPLSVTKTVLGKYLAMLTVFAVPTVLLCFIPVILSIYGTVNLAATYANILAFFLLGATLIAIGMFMSSLTESQIISAVLTVAAIFTMYLANGIAGLIPNTSMASVICFLLLAAAAALIYYNMTGNITVSCIIFIAAGALIIALRFILGTSFFEGLFPKAVSSLAIFDRLDSFVNGIFDVTGIVYYASITFFFVALTVQSVERKKWL